MVESKVKVNEIKAENFKVYLDGKMGYDEKTKLPIKMKSKNFIVETLGFDGREYKLILPLECKDKLVKHISDLVKLNIVGKFEYTEFYTIEYTRKAKIVGVDQKTKKPIKEKTGMVYLVIQNVRERKAFIYKDDFEKFVNMLVKL